MKTNLKLVMALLALGGLWLGTTVSRAASVEKPNIVFILADDLGWTDLGCMGSQYYETPNIDRLARQGLRMMNYHNCQNCAPTRAALMSGQYPPRTGVYTVGNLERGKPAQRKMHVPENVTSLPLDRKTIADQLQAAGYATALFGKWHLGQKGDHHPGQRGFDEALVSSRGHFNFVMDPPVEIPKGTYLADFITDKAVDFIERKQHQSFFLYLPHFAVHSPYHAKQALIERYRRKPGAGGHDDPVYAAMIHSVDESVGRVMAKLDELNLSQKTVLIFSSDNGGVGSYEKINGKGITDNSPLRGGKGMLYEGGVRVPFIARWPGIIPAGQDCPEPAIHVDIYPTFLELARASAPSGQVLDGESLLPLWLNPDTHLKRSAIFVHFPGYLEGYGTSQWRTSPAGSIQEGDWKLMEFFEDSHLELYNLQQDIGEKKNLAQQMPERVKELHSKLAAWRKELNAAMPALKTESE